MSVQFMETLYFNIDPLKLMVIPGTQTHLDGHAIIKHTYSVFRDMVTGNRCWPAASKAHAIWKRSRT